MPSSTYLGTAQFGTEAMHTNGDNVTFEASGVELTIETKSQVASNPSGPAGKPPAKSNAVSLKGIQGFTWSFNLLEGAIGAWMVWSWVL